MFDSVSQDDHRVDTMNTPVKVLVWLHVPTIQHTGRVMNVIFVQSYDMLWIYDLDKQVYIYVYLMISSTIYVL